MNASSAFALEVQAKEAMSIEVTALSPHVETARAELCAIFSGELDTKDRGRIAAAISLAKDGVKQKVLPTDLSLTPAEICVQNLEHRHNYTLSIQKLEAIDGKAQFKPFSGSVSIRDRKPVLSFVGAGHSGLLPRHVPGQQSETGNRALLQSGMAHVLRSVNVLATHLTLYKVSEREAFAGAWQQFKQAHLSPSESLTFAKEKGQKVFESDLVFGEAPNQDQLLVAPMPPDKEITPGLYYLAAAPRGKEDGNPGLFAGQWFLVSDLRLAALRLPGGVQIFASTINPESPIKKEASLFVLSPDGKLLGEAKANQEGSAFIPLGEKELKDASLLVGQTPEGTLDFLELGSDKDVRLDDLLQQATMLLDRDLYKSGDVAAVLLHAQDQSGNALDTSESFLKLQSADGVTLLEQKLPPANKGVAAVKISLPIFGVSTDCSLVWVRNDGVKISETSIHIKSVNDKGYVRGPDEKKTEPSESPPLFQGTTPYVIKTLREDGRFPENSVAVLSISAQDAAGRRRAQKDVYYLIYEEGRSFDWFASEGHWDYEPLPKHRRVGGGRLDLVANEDAVVFWPVTTGQYTIELTNARGDVLARRAFGAGYGNNKQKETTDDAKMRLITSKRQLEIGQDNKINLSVSEPAVVTMLVSDGKVLQATQKKVSAGSTEFIVSPKATWGRQIIVRFEAFFGSAMQPVLLRQRMSLFDRQEELSSEATVPTRVEPLSLFSIPIQVSKIKDKQPTFVRAVISPDEGPDGRDKGPFLVDPLQVGSDGKVKLKVDFPLAAGGYSVRLATWNDRQLATSVIPLTVRPQEVIAARFPPRVKLGAKNNATFSVTTEAKEKTNFNFNVIASQGVQITSPRKGKYKIGKGMRYEVPVVFSALARGDANIQLELLKADGTKIVQTASFFVEGPARTDFKAKSIPVEADATAVLPQDGIGASVSPLPVMSDLSLLKRLMTEEPRTTEEIALWLKGIRQWKSVLVGFYLTSERELDKLYAARLLQIQLRRNTDGGFASLSAGDPSDIPSTAAAIVELASINDVALGLSVQWLTGKMQNTWFDEEERPVRAIALESLARLKRVDVSAIRYLSDTSKEQEMPDYAAFALAGALAQIGDNETAGYWYNRATAAQANGKSSLKSLSWQSRTSLSNPQQVVEALSTFIHGEDKIKRRDLLFFVTAWGEAMERAGSWRIQMANQEEKYFGAKVFAPVVDGQDVQARSFVNKAGRRLYLTSLEEDAKKKGK